MTEKANKAIKIAPATRRVARVVFSTIKKIGSTRGVTLKKIHDYIKDEYPNTPTNMVRLSNTLEKALAFGAVDKKNNRYLLGGILKSLVSSDNKPGGRVKKAALSINSLCRSCNKGRRRRSRSRRRRRRSRSRRRRGGRRRKR